MVDNHTHLDTVVGFVPDDGGPATGTGSAAGAGPAPSAGPWTGTGLAPGARPATDADAEAGRPDAEASHPEERGTARYPPRTLADHLALAAAAGVVRMVQIGCDLDAVRWTDAAVRDNPSLIGGVAIHPNEVVLHAGIRETAPDGLEPSPLPRHAVSLDDAIARVAAVAEGNRQVRVLGETGLDHFRAGEHGRGVQRAAFRAHIALAKELDLVLQIHDRDAHMDVMDVLERDGAPTRTVFHCFSGDADMAQRCVAKGWYLSFAGPVSYPVNEGLRDALRVTPLSRLLVETDAPYLAPQPARGRPNAPYLLPHTVRAVAQALGRPLSDVCAALARTATDLYGS